jgi:hypothetical protein
MGRKIPWSFIGRDKPEGYMREFNKEYRPGLIN